jgi:hypothetical protein
MIKEFNVLIIAQVLEELVKVDKEKCMDLKDLKHAHMKRLLWKNMKMVYLI